MKIALINNLYYPLEKGGAERVLHKITLELKSQGHCVFVIASKPFFKNLSTKDEVLVYRLNSIYYYLDKVPFFLRIFWHLWNAVNLINYFKIKNILKNEQPDIVMTHNLMGLGTLTVRSIRALKIKHVHTLHDIQLIHPSGLVYLGEEAKLNNPFTLIYSKINAWLIGSPSLVISPSQWLLDSYKNKGFFKHSDLKVLLNPVEIASSKNKNKRKKNQLLFVGQIEDHKGIFT
ncbi:MAG: glycosyltransferase, partial [Candidatus Falkowbacteria bacterium]|nr:glycosyltransferase [Candidatus Falkowbacteria bacterium]